MIERYPVIAVLGAEVGVLFGQPAAAERLAGVAERALAEETLPRRELVEADLALLRALMCRYGVARMRADARLAWERLAPGDAARAFARLLEGISHLVDGDADRAATRSWPTPSSSSPTLAGCRGPRPPLPLVPWWRSGARTGMRPAPWRGEHSRSCAMGTWTTRS